MSDSEVPDARRRRNRRLGWGTGLLAAGAIGGAVLGGALPASAASPSPSTTSGSTTSGQPAAPLSGETGSAPTGTPPAGGPGGGGAGGQRSDETVLTGTLASQAKAAALKAVPGATVIRVETDADGATYEAHLKKADGSLVTVKFDKNLAVTAVQAGMGTTKQQATTSGGTGSGA